MLNESMSRTITPSSPDVLAVGICGRRVQVSKSLRRPGVGETSSMPAIPRSGIPVFSMREIAHLFLQSTHSPFNLCQGHAGKICFALARQASHLSPENREKPAEVL